MTQVSERAKLCEALNSFPYVDKVFASDANFLLFRLADPAIAKKLYLNLADAGVVIRFRGDQINCSGCLRATVGTPAENKAFLALLHKTATSLQMA